MSKVINPDITEIKEAYMVVSRTGDAGEGDIYLKYDTYRNEELTVEVSCGMRGGPDGLSPQIDPSLNEKVNAKFNSNRREVLLSKRMREHALETLSHYRGFGQLKSETHGLGDGWTPDF
jgi:hypothetical protein